MEAHIVDALVPDEPAAVRFMDTVYAERSGLRDALTTRAELTAFLAGAGARPARVSADDLADARRLRDALRRLAADVTNDERAGREVALPLADAAGIVNDAVRWRPVPQLRRGRGGWRFAAGDGGGVRAWLGELAAEGAALLADPQRPLRACSAPGCVLYFVREHPRREWCSVGCGNRVRAARHYARVRGQASAAR